MEGARHHPAEGRLSSGTPLNDLEEDAAPWGTEDTHPPPDVFQQPWHPFFRSRVRRVLADRPSRRQSFSGIVPPQATHRTIVPSVHDVPTLTLGGSISTQSSDDSVGVLDYLATNASRAASPDVVHEDGSPGTESVGRDADLEPLPKSRRSFSFSGLFSNPSTAAGNSPTSGIVRRSSFFTQSTAKRRVFSAPQTPKTLQTTRTGPERTKPSGYRSARQIRKGSPIAGPDGLSRNPPSPPTSPPSRQMNRLSAFEFELPGASPLYPEPTSTTPEMSSPDLYSFSPPSPSPFNSIGLRNKAHRPSGAPSDLTSTLVGSENDTSRLLSGDEDDFDGASDTVYDSTRTGATGSSHSALRRPAIETIFDESPRTGRWEPAMREITSSNETILASGQHQGAAVDVHPAPGRVSALCKEEASPTPRPQPETNRDGTGLAGSVTASFETGLEDGNDPSDDDDWDFDQTQESPSLRLNGTRKEMRSTSNAPPPVPQIAPATQDFSIHVQVSDDSTSKSDALEWPEGTSIEDHGPMSRPKTMSGKHGNETRGSRLNGRRGTNAMHLRSQSVPVPSNGVDHRHSSNTAKLESWVLGSKGVSEEWDDDFQFEELERSPRPIATVTDTARASTASTMLVPRSIMERQASVHGQFGHVKELTLLVEELKKLQQQASARGIMGGQSAELWKEAEGIINLATVDEDADSSPNRSPRSPSFDFDLSDEESPQAHRRGQTNGTGGNESRNSGTDTITGSATPARPSPDKAKLDTPPSASRPRKESAAKAKSVLENIYQHRSPHSSPMLHATARPEKLPFDTTSLRDLVTRAGVITRALMEIMRRTEESNRPADMLGAPPDPPSSLPPGPPPPTPDPAYTKIFQRGPSSPPPLSPPTLSSIPKASTPRSSKSSTSSPQHPQKMSRAASGTKSPKGNKSPKRASSVHKTSIASLNSNVDSTVSAKKSPRTPKSPKHGNYVSGGGGGGGGGGMATPTAGNDHDITGHMKIMTVV